MLCSVMVLLVLMVLQIMQHIILFIKVKDVHFVRRVKCATVSGYTAKKHYQLTGLL